MTNLKLTSLKETERLGQLIGESILPGTIIFLEGDLGAGKTTLTKSIAKALGVKEIVNSPTYTLVKEYHSGKVPLIHLDLYRLGELSVEDEEMVEDYNNGENILIIEWGKDLLDLYPKAIQIQFDIIDDSTRMLSITGISDSLSKKLKESGT